MTKRNDDAILQQLKRIADALERRWPPLPDCADLAQSEPMFGIQTSVN